MLSYLSTSEESVKAIAAANGIRPLVQMLSNGTPPAQAHTARVLSEMAKVSQRNQAQIRAEGAITLLVSLIAKEGAADNKAAGAQALYALCVGQPETQKEVSSAGGIKPLVALLGEDDDNARRQGAGAIAALCSGNNENKDAIEKFRGISKLVGLLDRSFGLQVCAEAAAALAVLARDHAKNQDQIAALSGIEPLVALLTGEQAHHPGPPAAALEWSAVEIEEVSVRERVVEEAAAALWSLASLHTQNQVAIADADGIPPLVAALGLRSERAQEQAAGALASLALENAKNEQSIALLVVGFLASEDKAAAAKAARAISRLASANPSNQRSLATAGGIKLLVRKLDVADGGVGRAQTPEPAADGSTSTGASSSSVQALARAKVQKEIASAIWAMSKQSVDNQIAIAAEGGIPPLIALLEGHTEVHCDVGGALWSLGANMDNQRAIAAEGGIRPLVALLRSGSAGAQETCAGALYALAATSANRVSIADEGGIPLLVALFDCGSAAAIEQARGCLQTLVVDNLPNQLAVANEAVAMLKTGSSMAQEHVTMLLRNLAEDPGNRGAIAKAGAVPELVRQLEEGSVNAISMAAEGLGLIALKSAKDRAMVTEELVRLLGSTNEIVRQRASQTLTDMAAGEKGGGKGGAAKKKKKPGGGLSASGSVPLVNLLKDGLKDGRVEAQEYALRSLLSVTDAASKEAIVDAGCIPPLITALGGALARHSELAQEHAATVLSELAPIGSNAAMIKEHEGIEPLVALLSIGNADAKERAASSLGHLALRAEAAIEITMAGAVTAFVKWLVDPSLGPPEVAARALSDIALGNQDTQTTIAEEGAIPPLVTMVGASNSPSLLAALEPPTSPGAGGMPSSPPGATAAAVKAIGAALKVANVAAGALATLAKDNIVNEIMITEEGGIPPLVELLTAKTPAHTSGSYEDATKALWHLATTEDNQTAIAKAGGIAPLLGLLTSESDVTAQYAAAALQSLARDHTENQMNLAKAGAIGPLADLLGSDSVATQEHAGGALLFLASHEASRDAVVKVRGGGTTEPHNHTTSAVLAWRRGNHTTTSVRKKTP